MLLMLDQFPSIVFSLCFIYLSVSFFLFWVLFLFLFQPKLSLFVYLYMGVCLVEDWGFRPGGVHSHFLPHNLYSFPVHIVGTPGEVSAPGQLSGFHQAAQNSFSGAFRNSNPNFHIPYLPHHYIFLFQNQAPSKVKCHRTVLLQGSDSDRKAC